MNKEAATKRNTLLHDSLLHDSLLHDSLCIRNPFGCSTALFTGKTMEEFIELLSDGNLKLQLTNQPPNKFWISVQNVYPLLAREALKKLLPFATTYLCETGFLHYASTKTKYRRRLDTKAYMYWVGK